MPTYVVIHDYAPDSAEGRESVMPPHHQWLRDRVERGEVLGAGSFEDKLGAFLLFHSPSETVLADDIATDPFVAAGLIQKTVIREWGPKFGTLLESLRSVS